MMKIDRNSTYIEVKDFLEDIYVILNNNTLNQIDNIERKKLIERCKYILNIFELDYDTNTDNNAYLDMSTKLKSATTIRPQGEYVDFTAPPVSSSQMNQITDPEEYLKIENNTYDKCINDNIEKNSDERQTTRSIEPIITQSQPPSTTPSTITTTTTTTTSSSASPPPVIDCPFIGLPATHLQIKQSQKIGFLNIIEKRLFFDHIKKYYVGYLDDWLIFYGGGQTDLKPSFFINLTKNCECQLINGNNTNNNTHNNNNNKSDNKKIRDFLFQIQTNPRCTSQNKKYTFQASNRLEYTTWTDLIIRIINEKIRIECPDDDGGGGGGVLDEVITSSTSKNFRKLPIPPLQHQQHQEQEQQNHQSLSPTSTCASLVHEDSTPIHQSNDKRVSNKSDDIYEEPSTIYNLDENQMNNSNENQLLELLSTLPPEIPIKSTNKQSNKVECNQIAIDTEYDIPKSPPISILSIPMTTLSSSVTNKSNSKITSSIDITASSNSASITVNKGGGCGGKKVSTSSSSSQVKQHSSNNSDICNANKKRWFNRLTSSKSTKCNHPLVKQQSVNTLKSKNDSILTDQPPLIKITSNKVTGNKVNMIINQLEANGRLPIFSKDFIEKRNTFYDLNDSASNHNYEPVSIRTNK